MAALTLDDTYAHKGKAPPGRGGGGSISQRLLLAPVVGQGEKRPGPHEHNQAEASITTTPPHATWIAALAKRRARGVRESKI